LFFSALSYDVTKMTAILLTGMGRDGAQGLLQLKEKGAYTIAQDEKSSVIYGMPRAAKELGAAKAIMNPDAIRQYISALR
jgi:chemotaxis response regulator CheB